VKRLIKLAALLMLCSAHTVFAHGNRIGAIDIDHPWSRATVPAVPTGVAYFVMHNTGQEADRLLSATTPVAEKAELHTHIHENGMARMRKLDAIDIAPASSTALEPGGLHVMLIRLKTPLIKGQSFPLTLEFERAGSITIQVDVQAITDTSASHTGHNHGGHGGHKH